ncbi:MAG: SUMF1/EgtB/PvdO family nonheme iron enzyme [Saprospiraceae bacterium]|nr:SUMF1/EgtB/PvdO family nonheme iron enzyme [Saprospiraceae bacterium]MBK7371132.1 SUMF1/EgtB/PvdO family nonheme iron enzyme [Saprospiraceae bacterium]MBK7436368.1 SUMF1/EgtB/PvdO family nonheme iron enzyme [Saprospiraceae bacterium]MBK8281203.1 SUMF1/EgtB/PvdO family nonheme iron enzyme [Saprospiraceae bacterium]MBK8777088.1 SUMF1/EgtB/PvdO family nonheme iron enzyme [Saprospiraceae bacterium]
MNRVDSRLIYYILIFLICASCKPALDIADQRLEEGTFVLPGSISITSSVENHYPVTLPGMIFVPGGQVTLSEPRSPAEVTVSVKAFLLDSTEVTIAQFRSFVQATHYITDAEKFGNSGVFSMATREWALIDSANWTRPRGLNLPVAKDDEPVTQISWFDATAFCKWKGKRLPNEIEWEHAARNGRNDQSIYSWGDDWETDTSIFGNVWQGDFPEVFRNLDGYETVAPVGSFRSSPLGFKDLSGNVWEWCDNWRFEYEDLATGHHSLTKEKVIKGGSFLCAPNYCHGYALNSRMFTTPETSLFHMGCRCAKDVE